MGDKMGAGIIVMSFDGSIPKILGLVGDEFHRQKHNAIYDLPKGSLDQGESMWDCAVRETFEETGIQLEAPDVVIGPFSDSWLSMWLAEVPWGTSIHIGKNPVTGKLEHDGFEWLTREQAEKDCYPYLRTFVSWAFDNI